MSRTLTAAGTGLAAVTLAAVALAAGPDVGAVQQQALNWTAILMFLLFVLMTLGITYRAAMQTRSTADFYAACGGIT